MSASLLFKIAGGIFCLIPIGHTQMANEVIFPGLKTLGNAPAAYSSKVSWTQANGYFLTTALLCFKWSQDGLVGTMDKYVFGALLATHLSAGLAYFRKGIFPPTLVYWTSSLLLSIAALKGQ